MTQTCPKCGAVVAEGQRDRHGAFHTELERLAASVAEHHAASVRGSAEVDMGQRQRA